MNIAVIKTGGKQYVAQVGDILTVEKLSGDLKKGDPVEFSEVLLTAENGNVEVGTPFVSGKVVKGVVESVGRAKKVEVVKYKAKSRYLKRRGHRQPFVKVKISAI